MSKARLYARTARTQILIFLPENFKNFTPIPHVTLFFIFDDPDDPKKSYVLKLFALQQKYGKWGKIGQYIFFK